MVVNSYISNLTKKRLTDHVDFTFICQIQSHFKKPAILFSKGACTFVVDWIFRFIADPVAGPSLARLALVCPIRHPAGVRDARVGLLSLHGFRGRRSHHVHRTQRHTQTGTPRHELHLTHTGNKQIYSYSYLIFLQCTFKGSQSTVQL